MLKTNIRTVTVGVWLSLVAVIVASGMLTGAQLTASTVAFLLVTCIAPPLVMMMVWRGAPPPTVAEVINTVDRRT